MLKTFIGFREAALRLRDNQDGVVSFEYVIVAACVVGAVGLALTNGTTGIGPVLTGALGRIAGHVATYTP